jgi:hypothetical protein
MEKKKKDRETKEVVQVTHKRLYRSRERRGKTQARGKQSNNIIRVKL